MHRNLRQLWDAVLDDPRTAAKLTQPIQQCHLSEIRQYVLRVGCQRCLRIAETQKADAVRFYGLSALWKDGIRPARATATLARDHGAWEVEK